MGWRRVSWAAGLGGIGGPGMSSMNGSETPPVHDGQPLEQLMPQLRLWQQIGPRGIRQSRAQPIFLTVFGMMLRSCRPQQGEQHVLQLETDDVQLETHDVQLAQPQPS